MVVEHLTKAAQGGAWWQLGLWSVGVLAGGFVALFILYAIGEYLTVLVDIERNTRPVNARGKRYWALPLLAFVFDLLGLLSLLASVGLVAILWLIHTGVMNPPGH